MRYSNRLILGIAVLVGMGIGYGFGGLPTTSWEVEVAKAELPPITDQGGQISASQVSTTPELGPAVSKKGVGLVDEQQKKSVSEGNPIQQRIAQDVETLRQEDTATSLKMLSEVGMYYWPGAHDGGLQIIEIPFEDNIGSWEVESIFSNRRVLKLLAECSELPKEEAGRMVRDELRVALADYEKMFEAEWKRLLQIREKLTVTGTRPSGVGSSLQISDNPDHSPTLSGLRFKVLSLMLIAGNLELTEAKDQIAAATKLALDQRKRFYTSQEGTMADRFVMLKTVGIYNRQILMTAHHGMLTKKFDDVKIWDHRKLNTFEVKATSYDHMMGAPDDVVEGTMDVWVHKTCDDKEFDQFMGKGK